MSYGCKDRKPLQLVRKIQDGWYADGRRKMKVIPDPMTKDCQHAKHGYAANDKHCMGCIHDNAADQKV